MKIFMAMNVNPTSWELLDVAWVGGKPKISVKKLFFDYLKVQNELRKSQNFGPPDQFFHGEIDVWSEGTINPPLRFKDRVNYFDGQLTLETILMFIHRLWI